MVWRVVFNKMATLHEIETYWNINDLLDANILLDEMEEEQKREYDKLKKGK